MMGACKMSAPQEAMVPPQKEGVVTGAGTVHYLDFEGGFYGIVADDGSRYDPGRLEEEFQEDGLRVRFEIKILTGVMSTRMWGSPVELVALARLEN